MSDDNTAMSAEDQALVAEFGEDFVDTDEQPDTAAPAVETPDTPNEETPAEEPTVTDDVTDEKLPEGHDPFETLQDEGNEETPAAKRVIPQMEKDASNIATKWESLDETQKGEKLLKLHESGRTSTLESLATKLDFDSVDALLDEYTETETAEETTKVDMDAIKDEIREELRQELAPAFQQSERNRLTNEITKWASHNKLSKDETDVLVAPDSEISKNFAKQQFDPETGEKLSFNGRLKFALSNSEQIQTRLIDAKARIKAKGLVAGIQAKLPNTSNSGEGKTSLLQATDADILKMDDKDFLEQSDRAAGVRKW